MLKLSHNIKLFLAISLAILASPLCAEPAKLSLPEAIFLALRYNPNVQNSEIQRIADKFSLRVAQNEFEWQYAMRGSFDQTVSRSNGTAGSSRTSSLTLETTKNGPYGTKYNLRVNNPISQSRGNAATYNPGLDLNIEQPLLRGFGSEVTLTPLLNAYDQEAINKLSLKEALISTVQQVITSYRSLIQSQNNTETSELSLKSYSGTVKNVKALIKAGRRAPTDVLQAEANFANEKVTRQDSITRVNTERLNLLNIIGLIPETQIRVPEDVEDIKPVIPDLDESYQIALKYNISYQRSLYGLKATQRALVIAKDNARVLLNMRITASTGNGSGKNPNSGFRSLSNNKNSNLGIGFDLAVPINDYQIKQAIVNAKVQLQQVRIQIEASKRELKTTIINDRNDIKSRAEQIRLAKNALQIQQKTQQSLNAKLRYGLVSTFEVTSTQQDLDTSRQRLIQAKTDYLNSLTKLHVDMGVLLDKWQIEVRY